MRVIAGKCRSLPLKTLEGRQTRPTTDRIKETLFNMLQPYIPGSRFLDLFAGSGAIGIEALSRGAGFCCFVEQNRRAAACIRENLEFTGLAETARLLVTDARTVPSQLSQEEPFDLVFLDPPYDQGLERQVLEQIRNSGCISPETLFVVEASLHTDFSWLPAAGYEILKAKKYKTNAHLFLKLLGERNQT